MLKDAGGDYDDWREIEYRPAVAELPPYSLLPYLTGTERLLDIGCNVGSTSLFLARYVHEVIGIDINLQAVGIARQRAVRQAYGGSVDFFAGDILSAPMFGTFDVVVMIRVLTCFPDVSTWRRVLRRAHDLLIPGGILYIHDFARSDESVNYRRRYQEGEARGWRQGNFAVTDSSGRLLFVAHHHSDDEIEEIQAGYTALNLEFHGAVSMNGNACRMFRFIGRRQ
ncbi:MAG: class I SAM-dependent methyltransferase [Armatimonadota bacterium]